MFGLTEIGTPRAAAPRAGKSKGVVLLRSPRRVSWLAGWTSAHPSAGAPELPDRPAAPGEPASPSKTRNRP